MYKNLISINNEKYNTYKVKISWSDFTVSSRRGYSVIKHYGTAPFITFNINDNIFIGLETTLSKEMIKNTKVNEQTDITKFISDITYEDEKGWISIINGEYVCYLVRKDVNKFQIVLDVKSEVIENLNIFIDTIVEINNLLG